MNATMKTWRNGDCKSIALADGTKFVSGFDPMPGDEVRVIGPGPHPDKKWYQSPENIQFADDAHSAFYAARDSLSQVATGGGQFGQHWSSSFSAEYEGELPATVVAELMRTTVSAK